MFTKAKPPEVEEGKKLEADTEEQVEEHVKKKKILYPLYYDKARTVAKELGITRSPRAYLLDQQGKVTWEGWFSGPRVAEVEKLVRGMLGLAPRPQAPPKPDEPPKSPEEPEKAQGDQLR